MTGDGLPVQVTSDNSDTQNALRQVESNTGDIKDSIELLDDIIIEGETEVSRRDIVGRLPGRKLKVSGIGAAGDPDDNIITVQGHDDMTPIKVDMGVSLDSSRDSTAIHGSSNGADRVIVKTDTSGAVETNVASLPGTVAADIEDIKTAMETINNTVDGNEIKISGTGIAGTPNNGIVTIQGHEDMTPVKVDIQGVEIDVYLNHTNDSVTVHGHPDMVPLKVDVQNAEVFVHLNSSGDSVAIHGSSNGTDRVIVKTDTDGTVETNVASLPGTVASDIEDIKTAIEHLNGTIDGSQVQVSIVNGTVTANAGSETFIVGGQVAQEDIVEDIKPVLVGGVDDDSRARHMSVNAEGNVQVDVVSGTVNVNGTASVEGPVTTGALVEDENPVLIGGIDDESSAQIMLLDTEGHVQVDVVSGTVNVSGTVTADPGTGQFIVGGNVATNESVSAEKPVLVGGEDDLGNAQNIAVDTDGNVQVDVVSGSVTVSGTVTADPGTGQFIVGGNIATNGSVSAEKPVLVGGEDSLGNAQNIAVDTKKFYFALV